MPEVSLNEAAEILGLSVAQVRRKVKAKVLESHLDERGRYRVHLEEQLPTPAAPDLGIDVRTLIADLRAERDRYVALLERANRATDELSEQLRLANLNVRVAHEGIRVALGETEQKIIAAYNTSGTARADEILSSLEELKSIRTSPATRMASRG
jgi:hypothetical protein